MAQGHNALESEKINSSLGKGVRIPLRMDADGNNLSFVDIIPHDQSSGGGLDVGFLGNLLCSKSSLKVIPYNQGRFMSNHATSYTKSNPHIWTTWRSKGFGIHPPIAEKRGT